MTYGTGIDSSGDPQVLVRSCAPGAWEAVLERAPNSVDWAPAACAVPLGARLALDGPLPVLFWGQGAVGGHKPLAEISESGTLVFNADILASTFFMLSRWEETVVSMRAKYERFPATASVAYKQGFLDRPLVDEYALILRHWLRVMMPRWTPQKRSFSIKLSHDVDRVGRLRRWYDAIPAGGLDLFRHRSVHRARQTIAEGLAQAFTPHRTLYSQRIRLLAELSHKYGFAGDAFYLMAADPGPEDGDYDIASPLITRYVRDLTAQGFEIGLHASFHTLNNPEKLAQEKERLDAVLGHADYGGRQHNLRFEVPSTWRHWEQVGLSYDSTMSYADHEGFRCGTCHPFQPFDVQENRQMKLWEWPLIVMDGSLRDYRQLTPEQGEHRILELATRCRQVEGTFTLLWHNSSFDWEWRPWAKVYERVLAQLR